MIVFSTELVRRQIVQLTIPPKHNSNDVDDDIDCAPYPTEAILCGKYITSTTLSLKTTKKNHQTMIVGAMNIKKHHFHKHMSWQISKKDRMIYIHAFGVMVNWTTSKVDEDFKVLEVPSEESP